MRTAEKGSPALTNLRKVDGEERRPAGENGITRRDTLARMMDSLNNSCCHLELRDVIHVEEEVGGPVVIRSVITTESPNNICGGGPATLRNTTIAEPPNNML